jgi:hypothetical protein
MAVLKIKSEISLNFTQTIRNLLSSFAVMKKHIQALKRTLAGLPRESITSNALLYSELS